MSPRLSSGSSTFLEIDKEACRADRAVDDPRRADAVDAQRGNEPHGVPVAVGRVAAQPFAERPGAMFVFVQG